MATEDTMQSSQAGRDERILRLRQKFVQKFAMMDQAGESPPTHSETLSSSSTARSTESAISTARTSELAEIIEESSNDASAGTIPTPDDVATNKAPASSSPAQTQRRDLKTAHMPESASLPTPPASIADEQYKNPSPAQASVFGTAELFEMILLELRIQNILVNSTRVCSEWKKKIDGSHRLQEALYFRPLPGALVEPRGEHLYEKRKRLLGEERIKAIEVLENPLMKRARRVYEEFERFRHMKGRTGESTSQSLRRKAREQAVHRKEASWRRMLAYQPPVLNLDFEQETWINIDAIENRSGLTMRDTAGDKFLYWRIGSHPITDLYRNMRSYGRARNIRRLEYDAEDEPEHGHGWEARCVQDWELDSDEEGG